MLFLKCNDVIGVLEKKDRNSKELQKSSSGNIFPMYDYYNNLELGDNSRCLSKKDSLLEISLESNYLIINIYKLKHLIYSNVNQVSHNHDLNDECY